MPSLRVWVHPRLQFARDSQAQPVLSEELMAQMEERWIKIASERLQVGPEHFEVLWIYPFRWSGKTAVDISIDIEFSVGVNGVLKDLRDDPDDGPVRSYMGEFLDEMLQTFASEGPWESAGVWLRAIHKGYFKSIHRETLTTKEQYFALEDWLASLGDGSSEKEEFRLQLEELRRDHPDWWEEYLSYHPHA